MCLAGMHFWNGLYDPYLIGKDVVLIRVCKLQAKHSHNFPCNIKMPEIRDNVYFN